MNALAIRLIEAKTGTVWKTRDGKLYRKKGPASRKHDSLTLFLVRLSSSTNSRTGTQEIIDQLWLDLNSEQELNVVQFIALKPEPLSDLERLALGTTR